MKKLLILLLATVTVIAFALPPFRIYNPTIMQRAGLDSLSITINDSDSVNITTSKAFVSYNKPLKVNGDSLPTITRVKELIGDSMQTITGFVDLTSEQTITGIKTFGDTLKTNILSTSKIIDTNNNNLITTSTTDVNYYGVNGRDLLLTSNDGYNSIFVINDGLGTPLIDYRTYSTGAENFDFYMSNSDTFMSSYYTPLGNNAFYLYGLNDKKLVYDEYNPSDGVRYRIFESAASNELIYTDYDTNNSSSTVDYYDAAGYSLIQTSNSDNYSTLIINNAYNDMFLYSALDNTNNTQTYDLYGLNNQKLISYTPTTTTIARGDTIFITMADTTIRAQKNLVAPKFYVSALNEAPASATSEGTTGEIRITAGYIYVCVSDDVWVRTELTTWP